MQEDFFTALLVPVEELQWTGTGLSDHALKGL
jgi:hypothetical protein